MSAVLRKMIDAGSGMPSSILQMQAFWEQLQASTKAWALETFGTETDPQIDTRQIISGETVRNLLDSQFSFMFASDLSPGLCAIAIDSHGGDQIATSRLQQDTGSMTEASPLFLKLLCETPAISLWQHLAGWLIGHQPDPDQTPLSDAGSAPEQLDPDSRYLQADLQFTLEGQKIQIWLIFDLDYVQKHAREYLCYTGDHRGTERSQSRNALRDSIRSSTLTLDVVLERLSLTIGDCSRLEIGQILELPGVNPGHLSLSAETVNDNLDIGHGEMGVWKQQRALKLNTPILEGFAREIAGL